MGKYEGSHPNKSVISPRIYHKQPISGPRNLRSNLLDTSHDSRRVGTTNSLNFLALLEEEEGGHSRDAVLSSDLGQLVDVDLEELDVLVLVAQVLDLGGDGLAGATPLGEEVDEDGVVLDGCVEFLLANGRVSKGFGVYSDGGYCDLGMETYEVISITLPPAILSDERENCGMGVLEKVRDGRAIVLGSRLVTGERSSNGDVALEREEKRARRMEVGGLIWSVGSARGF